ncbi:lamin tail domain-containing protein [Nonomuraea sp. K274]|uniref:Lamin tail domain-containing protein n=1 Tax=Nonomuraea cypriaca TaxID=1187855 RepID=A0A931F514_9ACTN|nr:lamin tail domain-containing protein [Nonomuraea cypriaca]MBF8191646.1 lamin tail domain-containing protein [Nonomuraea cypriaca]
MFKKILAAVAAVFALTLAASAASATAGPDLSVTRVNYNAVGADTAANRWQEAIYLKASSDLSEPLDISGWKVHDTYANADGDHTNAYTFPAGTVVKAGGTVVVSSAAGVNKTDPNSTQVYYMDFKRGYNGHWLNNGGDTVYVEKAGGDQVTKLVYDFDNGYYVR